MTFFWKAIDLRIRSRLFGLANKFLVKKTRIYGKEWKIPVIDYMGYGLALGKVEEHWIFREIQELQSNKVSAFIDIGSNIGQTLIKVKSLVPAIPYYCFDPNPNCIFYLNQLVRLNDLTHVSVSCLGIGAEKQLSKFVYTGKDDVCGSVGEQYAVPDKSTLSINIPVWPLDDFSFLPTGDGVVVLKIDVEGYELEVLQGAVFFLARYKPIIILEILPHQNNTEKREKERSIFNFLWERKYLSYLILRSSGRRHITQVPDNTKNLNAVDYIFIPDSISG